MRYSFLYISNASFLKFILGSDELPYIIKTSRYEEDLKTVLLLSLRIFCLNFVPSGLDVNKNTDKCYRLICYIGLFMGVWKNACKV